MTNTPNKIETEIMAQITSGQIKPRSKYIFWAEKLGLSSAFILSALLAVLFFNLVLFYLKASDDLIYLSFGSKGIFAFLETFPYLLVITLILLIFIAGYIIKKSEIFYHQSFGFLALIFVGSVMVFGFFLTYTTIAEQIEEKAYEKHPMGMVFRPFLKHHCKDSRQGVAGRIVEIENQNINLQTPIKIIIVDISRLERVPAQPLAEGMFVLAIGQATPEKFVASNIRIASENEMPLIKRRVLRVFGSWPPPPPPLEQFGN